MDWIPALSTTTLLAILIWLMRNWIFTRLTKSIQHEYDRKLEELRSDVRLKEESFKADLNTQHTQLSALSSGALTGIVNRQALLYKRQLTAVEELWRAVKLLSPARYAASVIGEINFDVASEAAARDERYRDVFKPIGGDDDIKNLKGIEASKSRPFVSPLAWALYSAYASIVMKALMQLHMLQNGINEGRIFKTDHLTDLVKTALPHQSAYIDSIGPTGFFKLLDELEESLLSELRNILKGEQSDKESVDRAAAILKASKQVDESTDSAKADQKS